MGDSIKELGKSIETSATRNKEAMQKQTKIIREESKSAVDSIREMAKSLLPILEKQIKPCMIPQLPL